MNKKTLITILAVAITWAVIATPVFADTENITRLGFMDMIKTKAQILGMNSDELTALRGSKTILEIAEEKGISQEDFRSQMHEQREAQLDEMLKTGTISQETYDLMKKNMEERHAEGVGGYENRGGLKNGQGMMRGLRN